MFFDIHAHILPAIDDGCETVEESLQLLNMLKQNGVDAVCATPHFYAEAMNLEEYIALSDDKFLLVKSSMTNDMPEIIRGFEVRYFKGISRTSDIKKLTLGNSCYMLVEFPYGQEIDVRMVNDIADVYYNLGITPILAHIERYHKYKGFEYALELIDSGVAMAHVNASSLMDSHKRTALKLIYSEKATLIATDTHSVLSRPPMLSEAKAVIDKNLGEHTTKKLFANSERIYKEIVK